MKSFVMRGLCLTLFFTLSVILFQSCQKEEAITPEKVTPTSHHTWKATPDADLVLFSKLLATAQKREEVRQFLDTWFKKDQLGENMVFFIQVKDQIVYENKSFLDIMKEEMNNLGSASLRTDYFADLIALYPNLGFSIYTGSDDISIADFEYNASVKVIPETVEFRKAEEKFETGYDENLNEKLFSNNEAPNEPAIIVENSSQWVMLRMDEELTQIGGVTLVVELCDDIIAGIYSTWLDLLGTDEFIVVDGDVVDNPIYEVLIMDFITYNQLWLEYCCTTCEDDSGGDDGDDPDPDPPVEECDRDDRSNDEHIIRVRVEHSQLKQFCKWGRNKCNIEVRQLMAFEPDNLTLSSFPLKFINEKRNKMKNDQIVEVGLDMFPFLFLEAEHGKVYSMNFVGKHHNPDGQQTLSLSLTPTIKFKTSAGALSSETSVSGVGASFTATFANNDINLGGDIVEYCDDANGEGSFYTTGSIEFRIKEAE